MANGTPEIAADTGTPPDVKSYNSLGIPDGEFKPLKDVHSPIRFLDALVGGTWVTFEDLGVGDLVAKVSVTDTLEAKERSATITFFDPDGSIVDSEIFSEGLGIRISMSFLGDIGDFGSWVVDAVNPKIGDGVIEVELQLKSESINLTRTTEPTKFEGQTASEIVTYMAEKYGLTPVVTSTPEVIPEWAQAYENDKSVIDKLAQAYGFEWYVVGEELHFHPQTPKKAEVTLIYRPGQELKFGSLRHVSVTCKKDKDSGKAAVKSRVNTKSGEEVTGESDIENDPEVKAQIQYFESLGEEAVTLEEFYGYKDPNTGENVPFSYYMNTVELDAGGAALISSRLTASERINLTGLTLTAGCSYGISSLKAGLMAPIMGIGKKYSGLWKLTKVTHTVDSNGYMTEVESDNTTRARGEAGTPARKNKGGTGTGKGQVGGGNAPGASARRDKGIDAFPIWQKAGLNVKRPGE